jgi:signal transduction histidine kinase
VGGLFGPEEEGVAAFIATLAGAALENAENFGEIEGLTRTLEERVQERTTQLERSNRELDRSLRKLQVAYDRERDVVRKLRELDELKSDFLSTVSHELRTPLTAIGGFSQTLLDRWDGLSDDVRSDFVKRIARHSGDLDALISELLDFSRLERGSLKIQSQPCDVRRYVEASVHKLGPVLARHEVVIDVPEGAVVLADPIACERALENLLTNAAKFSAPGTSIEVRAAEDGDRVVVSVKDSGLGIPADERDHIFERFYRIERGDHAKTGGTGIGLAIVKEFIEAQGGSVWVNSRPGEGSVFSFSLKRAVDTPPAVVARSPGAEVP